MSRTPASPFDGMGAREVKPQGRSKKDDRPKLPRHPKPLRVTLLHRIEDLERELRIYQQDGTWKEALDEYRESVSSGITNPFYLIKYRDCGALVNCAKLLDEAFASIHNYRPEDWLTPGVLSAAARFNRKGKIDAGTSEAEEMLHEMGIAKAPKGNEDTTGTQGWIKNQVRLRTGLGDSTIEKIAARLRRVAKSQKGNAIS